MNEAETAIPNQHHRLAGWAAYLSAIAGALGILALIGFFAFEFRQAVAENWANTYPFGNLNDWLNIVQALAMLPAALALYRSTRRVAPILSLVTLLVGITGLLMLASTQALYVTHGITSQWQTALYSPSWRVTGLWVLLVSALAMLPAALGLYRSTRRVAPILSLVMLIVGVAGLLMLASTQAMYVPRGITSQQQTALYFPSWGVTGLWVLLVNALALHHAVLPRWLARLGVLIGACLLVQMIIFEAFGGAAIAADPASILDHRIVLIGSSAGLFLGIMGWPVWAFGVGRMLQRGSPESDRTA